MVKNTENLEEIVLEKIDSFREDIIKFHQRLVQIPSENPPGNYAEVSSFVQNKFEELGLKSINKRDNIIATYGTSEVPSLIIYGHMDTVPVGEGWSKDPFGGEIVDGKVYGRGACDDKACVTAEIFATKALIESGFKIDGKLIVLAAIDEETGGFNGVKFLLDGGIIDGDVCLVGDGRGKFPVAYCGGFIFASALITGKTSHALNFPDIPKYRNEYSGINAIQKMVKILNFLKELQKEFLKTETEYPNLPVHPSKVSIVHLATIESSGKHFAVPNKCLLQFIISTIPEHDTSSIKTRILNFVDQSKKDDPYLDIELNFYSSFEPFVSNTNTPFSNAVQKAVSAIYNEEREFKFFQSANDGHWFHEKGIETLLMGVGTHENSVHAEDEFVYIEDLMETTKIFALTILNYFKSRK